MKGILNKICNVIRENEGDVNISMENDMVILQIGKFNVRCPKEFIKKYGNCITEAIIDEDKGYLLFIHNRMSIYLDLESSTFSFDVQSKLDSEIASTNNVMEYDDLKKWIKIIDDAFAIKYECHDFNCIIPELAYYYRK